MDKEFQDKLENYKHSVASQNGEATKAYLFLEFVRDVFKDAGLNAGTPKELQLEKYIKSNKTILVKGRVDALLGNLIIEFESDVVSERKINEAKSQLKRYTAILWNNEGIIQYLCIATDGLFFHIFRPRSPKSEGFTEADIELEPVDKFDLRKEDTIIIYKALDRYVLYQTLAAPTGEKIVGDFGPESPILKYVLPLLQKAWDKVKNENVAIYQEWSRYLSIVYGTKVDSDDLFLKHTYLATLAKLMVYSYYQKNTLPTSNETIVDILRGAAFRQYGIENFIVEDFFSWLVRGEAIDIGIDAAGRLIDGLERYDLTKLNEDVFKDLYQQLVDPSERHDLGEYYTPDWLAEMVVRKLVNNPKLTVLDPSCGSGTFLAATIRHKISLLAKQNAWKALKEIIQSVSGMDVHPLAVLISKANYLMALGDELLAKKEATISIPVFMADSIVYPVPFRAVERFGPKATEEIYLYRVDKQTTLTLPRSLVDAESIDAVIDTIREYAIKKAKSPDASHKGFQTFLEKRYGVTRDQFEIVIEMANKLAELIRDNRDTIHPFILKNIYRPSILGKFDVIVGNPPWLSYRFVKSVERQVDLKDLILGKYQLLDGKDTKLLTQMELATLFLLRCAETYLADDGKIAFVLPRAIYTSDQHLKLRTNTFSSVKFGFQELWDFDGFFPLFNVPSCVAFGSKTSYTKYPIKAVNFKGRIKNRNARIEEIEKEIHDGKVSRETTEIQLLKLGDRSVWSYESLNICKGRTLKHGSSKYMDEFKQGATLVPRAFWFVEVKGHERLGFDPSSPPVRTSQRALNTAKEDYKDITLDGRVESDYLFATLLGSDILPFCNLPVKTVILPVAKMNSRYYMLDKGGVERKGHEHMLKWITEAEAHWNRVRKDKAEKMNIYGWLDYSSKLTKQSPAKRFRVIHNRSGTYLNACAVDLNSLPQVTAGPVSINLQGFVVDSTTHAYETSDEDDAYFITAILNCKVVDQVIKPVQSRGLWGARDIYKKPFELPIPRYDSSVKLHRSIASMGRSCSQKASSLLPDLLSRMKIDPAIAEPNAVGRLRTEIKSALDTEISQLDELICELITKPE